MWSTSKAFPFVWNSSEKLSTQSFTLGQNRHRVHVARDLLGRFEPDGRKTRDWCHHRRWDLIYIYLSLSLSLGERERGYAWQHVFHFALVDLRFNAKLVDGWLCCVSQTFKCSPWTGNISILVFSVYWCACNFVSLDCIPLAVDSSSSWIAGQHQLDIGVLDILCTASIWAVFSTQKHNSSERWGRGRVRRCFSSENWEMNTSTAASWRQ